MSLNANYQKLEPGDEVRLLEIDGQAFGLDEVLYFHGYNVPILQPKSSPLTATWISCLRKASGGRGGSIKPGHV
jgi:phage-related protein